MAAEERPKKTKMATLPLLSGLCANFKKKEQTDDLWQHSQKELIQLLQSSVCCHFVLQGDDLTDENYKCLH